MKKSKLIIISLALSSLFVISGCNSASKVTFYPSDDNSNLAGDSVDDKNGKKKNKKGGRVAEYNPTFLSLSVSEKANDEIKDIAVNILDSVDKHETEVDWGEDVTEAKFNLAYSLAMYSNPICYSAYFIPEEPGKYSITYIPANDGDPLEEAEYFKTEIYKVLEECNEIGASDAKIAQNVYDFIINNYELDLEFEEKLRDPESMVNDDENTVVYGNPMKLVLTGKGTYDDFLELYMFVLNQLQVKNIIVGSSGLSKVEDDLAAHYIEIYNNRVYWDVIMTSDEAYHCVMFLDLLNVYNERQKGNMGTVESKYFGLSDKTCEEFWQPYYVFTFGELVPGQRIELPECEKDYKNS